MKKIFTSFAVLFVFILSATAQSEEKGDPLLQEFSANACLCIDSIGTLNKISEEISSEIAKCIDKQVVPYQIGMQLLSIDTAYSASAKDMEISVFTRKSSPQYKKYYYAIERYLIENCSSLRSVIAAIDVINHRSVSENPEALEYYGKGQADFNNGDFDKAIANFEKAVEIDSLFAFAWDNLGLCYRKLGDYDRAIENYRQSLRIDPHGMMPLQNLAVTYQYKGDYEKAIEAYEKLAEISTNNAETFYGMGLVYATKMGEYEKGLDNMCKAYNLYTLQKSPYRSDAEKIISIIFKEMQKEGKSEQFDEILKNNRISLGNGID